MDWGFHVSLIALMGRQRLFAVHLNTKPKHTFVGRSFCFGKVRPPTFENATGVLFIGQIFVSPPELEAIIFGGSQVIVAVVRQMRLPQL